jgi:MFS family permease
MNNESNPSFKRSNTLLILQFLSDFGDQITASLLAISVLDISQSTSKVGLVYFFSTVGFVVFTLAGGFIGDRFSKRLILSSTDLARGLTVLLMIVAFNQRSLVLIYATSFLLSTLGSLQRPARITVWAASVPRNNLMRYNSLSELSVQASSILGPLIASFLVTLSWTNFGFAIDAITFFIGGLIFLILLPKETGISEIVPRIEQSFLSGMRLIAQNSQMAKYISYDALQMIGFGAFNATFLVLAQRDFHWSKIDFSYHLSIIAIFCVAGAMLGAMPRFDRISSSIKLIACACISSMALWAILVVQTFPVSSILFGICNGVSVMTVSVTRTKIQLIAKDLYPDTFASIIAARSVVIRAASLMGAGLCIIVDNFMDLTYTLALFAIPIALSSLPFFMLRRSIALPQR